MYPSTLKILLIGLAFPLAGSASTYYVSNTGNDANTGLDPASPWRSVSKVNSTIFAPGSQILFNRGDQWRESLLAPSSGTAEQPIVFDAYGSGAKPRFWGSDILNNSLFQPVAGSSSAYVIPIDNPFDLLIDHQFAHSADLLSGSTDSTTNINYVKTNPNTWYYTGRQLYVNTGGTNPATDHRTYTAVARENVIQAAYQNHIVFRNLVTDESARWGGGCGFRAFYADDIRIESSEAYRAGKHHFCVTDVNGFVGKDLYAAVAMPDLGYGGASPYVSYSDVHRSGDTSLYENVVAENLNGPYPGFITHGEGMGNVTIRNMQVHGGGITIITEGINQKIRVEGGLVEDGPIDVGNNVTVEGVRISGPMGGIKIGGSNNVIQNNLIAGRATNWWTGNRAAIEDSGTNNTIRFNTIQIAPPTQGGGAAIGINNSNSTTQIYGNLFLNPNAIIFYGNPAPISSHDNFFSPDSIFGILANNTIVQHPLKEWRDLGYDLNSIMGAIAFQNAGVDYSLASGSPGLNRITDPQLLPRTDLRGLPRSIGGGADVGAFERPLYGDANFDGIIDDRDYQLINAAFLNRNQNAGFANGDFNFSGGVPNTDDYFIIDRAFAQFWLQQAALAAQGGNVPEPAGLAGLVMAGCLLRRRQHDRKTARKS